MTDILNKIKQGKATIKLSPDTLDNFITLLKQNNFNVVMGYTEELEWDETWDGATGFVFYEKQNDFEHFYLDKNNEKNLNILKFN